MHITMAYSKDWGLDLPISEHVKDIHVCKECGEKVNQFVNSITEGGKV